MPWCFHWCRRGISPPRVRRQRQRMLLFIVFSLTIYLYALYNSDASSLYGDEGETVYTRQTRNLHDHSFNFLRAFNDNWVGLPGLNLDCTKAFLGQKQPPHTSTRSVRRISPAQIAADSRDCSTFREKYGFERYPSPTNEEIVFPLAFAILFHNDLDQVLLLLRALYRPQNVYCLHVDKGSGPKFVHDVQTVVRCFPNVFVASELQDVIYEDYSRLAADLSCMKDLSQHRIQWKYLLNMAGKAFPLRTNKEMVQILKILNGSSNIESISGKWLIPRRFTHKYIHIRDQDSGKVRLIMSKSKHEPAPHGLKVFKGSAYGIFSRNFVDFALNNKISAQVLDWSRFINSPDEYVWATLIRAKNIGVPNSYSPDVRSKDKDTLEGTSLSTYVSWIGERPCEGTRVRDICVFAVRDLPQLVQQPHLLANKFYISREPASLHCLDQLLYNLTATDTQRNLSFYRRLASSSRQQARRRVPKGKNPG